MSGAVDPIAAHVAALEGVLRGPRRTRRCMVEEARAGLREAAAAYRDSGLPADQAAASAVRDFGTVAEVAPSFQDELTARQGRGAAVLFALVFPGMVLGWDALWSSGLVARDETITPPSVGVLAGVQDLTTTVVAVAALALLAVTFSRTVPARILTRAVGLTGTAGTTLCGGLTVAMSVAGGRSTTSLLTTNPTAVAAFTGSGMVLALLVWQSVRTLHVARVTTPDPAMP